MWHKMERSHSTYEFAGPSPVPSSLQAAPRMPQSDAIIQYQHEQWELWRFTLGADGDARRQPPRFTHAARHSCGPSWVSDLGVINHERREKANEQVFDRQRASGPNLVVPQPRCNGTRSHWNPLARWNGNRCPH